MSDKSFRGDAVAVAAVKSATIAGTWAAGETVTCTINGKAITYTATGSPTPTTVAAGLVALLNASTIAEFAEITWSNVSGVLSGTGDTLGKSLSFTLSKSSTSGTVGSTSVTTATDGPNVFSAKNMSDGSLPGAADTLTFEDSTEDLLYELDAVSATLAAIYIEASYEATIGLPQTDDDGLYWQYRTRELTCPASLVVIGEGNGNGSGRILLNMGSVQTAIKVRKSSTPVDSNLYAVRVRGTHASNTLEAVGDCSVDVAADISHTATFSKITAGGDAKVRISRRTTVANLVAQGNAEVEIDQAAALADVTSITIRDNAKVILYGDNTITTVTITGKGTLDDRGSGTITTLKVGPQANYSTRQSTVAVAARIITNTDIDPGSGEFDNRTRCASFTNPITLGVGGLSDRPKLHLGDNIAIQVT